MRWLNQLFMRRRRYNELSESIREHLEEKIADLMDVGMTTRAGEAPPATSLEMLTVIESTAAKSGSRRQLNRLLGMQSLLCGG